MKYKNSRIFQHPGADLYRKGFCKRIFSIYLHIFLSRQSVGQDSSTIIALFRGLVETLRSPGSLIARLRSLCGLVRTLPQLGLKKAFGSGVGEGRHAQFG